MAKKLDYDYCRAAPVMEWISNKWSMAILLQLESAEDKPRFNDLFRSIPHISEKMLASSLELLCADGLVFRIDYGGIPPRVEYELTPLSRSLLPLIHDINRWGQEHFDEIIRSRREYAEQHSNSKPF